MPERPTPALRRNRPARPIGSQPTLRTIADMTGLGVTTVSRALKDGPELSAETQARVREVAERNRLPPASRRRASQDRPHLRHLLRPQPGRRHERLCRRLIMGISEALRGTQLPSAGAAADDRPGSDRSGALHRRHRAADGLILTHSEPQDMRVKMLLERDLPFITFGQHRACDAAPLSSTTDNFDFAYRAAQCAHRARPAAHHDRAAACRIHL